MVCTGFEGGWQVASSISPKIGFKQTKTVSERYGLVVVLGWHATVAKTWPSLCVPPRTFARGLLLGLAQRDAEVRNAAKSQPKFRPRARRRPRIGAKNWRRTELSAYVERHQLMHDFASKLRPGKTRCLPKDLLFRNAFNPGKEMLVRIVAILAKLVEPLPIPSPRECARRSRAVRARA
jgi:hypothetical protein